MQAKHEGKNVSLIRDHLPVAARLDARVTCAALAQSAAPAEFIANVQKRHGLFAEKLLATYPAGADYVPATVAVLKPFHVKTDLSLEFRESRDAHE